MNARIIVFLLPYLVSLLVKLWAVMADPRLMRAALDNLASFPKPAQVQFHLDPSQRQVIVAHLTQTSIKSTILVTFFSSFIAGVAALFEAPNALWMAVSLVVILLLGFTLAAWIIPSSVPELTSKWRLGIEKGSWAVLFSCLYDVILACLAYSTLHRLN